MDTPNKYLIVIGGPTGIGKTSTAIAFAVDLDCPVISADSRQFYKEMNIGTAKPSQTELDAVPHYFINNLSIHDSYSVGQYEREVIAQLDEIYKTQDLAILVGGTGLYINAVLNGIDEFPDVQPDDKKHYSNLFSAEGILPLQQELKEKDAEYAAKVDIDNPHRLIRALSVIRASGKPFSSFLQNKKESRVFQPIKIALRMERHLLYNRINQRVDLMIEAGLEQEVRSLYKHKVLNALNTVGYSEIFDHLDGKQFMSEAIEKIKQNTRRYAKRQITWFNNQGEWQYFDADKEERVISFVKSQIA